MKVDSQVKEIERLRYDIRNQRKNFQTAANNTSSIGAAMVGASLVGKLNLPRPGGYQPMHSANTRGEDPEGSGTDRSQDLKQGLRGSVNFSKNFLTQSLASNFASKLKEGPLQESMQDSSMTKSKNLLSTPNSKISEEHDNDTPNMAGKDSPTYT